MVSFSAFKIQDSLSTVMEMAIMNNDLTEDEFIAEAESKLKESTLEFLTKWGIDVEILDVKQLQSLAKACREYCSNLRFEASKYEDGKLKLQEQCLKRESELVLLRKRNTMMQSYSTSNRGGEVYRAAVSLHARIARLMRWRSAEVLQACARRYLLCRPVSEEDMHLSASSEADAASFAEEKGPNESFKPGTWTGSIDGHTKLLLEEEEQLEDHLRRLGVSMDD